jgi:two-component system sensor histidine kinase AlgZ
VISSGVEMNDTGSQQAKGRSFARTVAMVLMVNAASALAVVVLRGLTSAGLTGKQFVEALITSVVYANCCGTLAALAMPRVARRLSRKPFPMSWVYYLGAILGISVIGCLIAVIILTRIGMFPPWRYWLIFRSSLGVSTVIALIIGVSTYFYQRLKHRLELTTRELQLKELEEERARKLALEARLSSLESRIHPHFLFNTLNSISSLIQEDPALAERLVERLAALLRFSLDSDQSSLVPLERELKIVTDYLEIEKARFGGKLQYSIEVPAELQTVEVPPLSVQTLVENSLKHVVSARREGGEICVAASLAGGRVSIEVRDNGPGFATGALRAGHGLENLQARLIALFDDRAALEWSTRGGPDLCHNLAAAS